MSYRLVWLLLLISWWVRISSMHYSKPHADEGDSWQATRQKPTSQEYVAWDACLLMGKNLRHWLCWSYRGQSTWGEADFSCEE